jgi:LuxR family transcriptional regulator, quorum-sensing system regulator SolR
MDAHTPINFDSETLDGLLSDWLNELAPYGVGGVVILAPALNPDGQVAASVAAVHPPYLLGAANDMCQAGDLESAEPADLSIASLVDWTDLNGQALYATSKWRLMMVAHGMRSMVRLRFRLPFNHFHECVLFSARALTHRSEAAELSWMMLSMWPVLRRAIMAKRIPLSPRELECLTWASKGLTAGQTGDQMQCSERNVVYLLGNVMRKMQVTSKTEAVFRAAVLGLL